MEKPKYDPKNLQKAIKKASVNWNKIEDVEQWIDDIRGGIKKQHQEQYIEEIMQSDEKDGIYDAFDLKAKAKEMIEDFRKANDFPLDEMDEQRWYICQQNAIKSCEWNIKQLDSLFLNQIIPDQLHETELQQIESLIERIKNFEV